MGWLEDYLAASQGGQNALLAAAQAGGTMAPDPGENGPQSAGPVAQQPTTRGVPANPIEAFLRNYGAYRKAHGGHNDAALMGALRGGEGVRSLGTGITTTGPRAGLGRSTLDLGGGWRAHVYYDENGKRQVFRFRAPAS